MLFGNGKDKEDKKDISKNMSRVNLKRDTLFFDSTIFLDQLEELAAGMEPELRGKVRFICKWHPNSGSFRWRYLSGAEEDSTKCRIIFKLFPNLEKVSLVPNDEIRCVGRWTRGTQPYEQMRELQGRAASRKEILRKSALEVLSSCWKQNFQEICEAGDEPGNRCPTVEIVSYDRFYFTL